MIAANERYNQADQHYHQHNIPYSNPRNRKTQQQCQPRQLTDSSSSDLYNWDEPSDGNKNNASTSHINVTSTTSNQRKGKQVAYSTEEIDALHKKIEQQDIIIKDLCGQIKGIDIKQKEQTEHISLLQKQERLNSQKLENLSQKIHQINETITQQQPHILQIPEIHDMLKDIRNRGLVARPIYDNEHNNAYRQHNYSHPSYEDDEYVNER
ncbi:hypothetical protein RhiirC2_822635 [Rhizophagus irregularis]|uniref:Uncharacterized protein n=1 Tax=Rhizophagus irregularis TaxID=588596 RepID=A0A2N1MAK6_9GLOM|nr:hypothetical protein RhiirC2_822635 [Rhizophagus irregularis]